MIKSFASKKLQAFFIKGTKKGIRPEHSQRIADILDRLNAAAEIRDMNYPGSRLHPLKGTFETFWSVSVSGNWRIVFRFEDGYALDVNYLDYH